MILLPTLMMLCISQTENQRRLLLFTWTIKNKKGKKTSKYTQVEVKKDGDFPSQHTQVPWIPGCVRIRRSEYKTCTKGYHSKKKSEQMVAGFREVGMMEWYGPFFWIV
ncbi:hypothetical protein ASPFODRAFT_659383 [Aspergillus luchuensis CBS 106.47]|uniref:Uncharacterized protein n=1 Tax=Aspergillus luchuensis (strain CBS 106.47) TaxID=1137211 RepID=A0A1M3TEZ4_ASPLC|nr:hypothetical protein ASPFODRAFT_659383 [Aspergillus luchuensis CBS 106.47]